MNNIAQALETTDVFQGAMPNPDGGQVDAGTIRQPGYNEIPACAMDVADRSVPSAASAA